MAPSVLPLFPIVETFRLFGACLSIAAVLVLAAVPLTVIGYELWKERVR